MKKVLAFVLALVVVFSATSMIGYASTIETVNSFSVSTVLNAGDNAPTVEWYRADDGTYYLFLPTSIDTKLCKVSFDADGDVTVDGVRINNGDVISLAGKSQIKISCNSKDYTVKIIKESRVASMFITTESGTLDNVHANKDYKESGYIQVVDSDGVSYEYDGDLDYIKGRGNSTWKMEKKPYNLKLDKKADLFGMGKSKKWSLIANHGDSSQMRNVLAYYVAGFVLDYTPKFTPVDLYINNEYMGAYLLTTRVEVGDNRVEINDLDEANEDANPELDFDSLDRGGVYGTYSGLLQGTQKWVEIPNDPDDITGGYLMEFEIADRYQDEISGFVSNNGQPIIFKNPEYATENEVKYIAEIFQDFEDAILDENGYSEDAVHYTDLCDVETFQIFYAVNEWASNMDFGLTSTYLYKPENDNKLYAGPVWDFDIAFGNNGGNRYGCDYTNPEEFTVCFGRQFKNTIFKSQDIHAVPTLFNSLCQREEFVEGVKAVWDAKLQPIVKLANDVFIPQYSKQIEGSVVANAIRWNIYGTKDVNSIKTKFNADVEYVKNFSTTRAEFLTENFGTVQVQDVTVSVEQKIYMAIGTAVNEMCEWFIVHFGLENTL